MMAIKLGKRRCCYKNVKRDAGGWVDADNFIPEDYDLCYLKTKDKTYVGWWTGLNWDCAKPIEGKVLYWKRNSVAF
jgi:hypothetical protein